MTTPDAPTTTQYPPGTGVMATGERYVIGRAMPPPGWLAEGGNRPVHFENMAQMTNYEKNRVLNREYEGVDLSATGPPITSFFLHLGSDESEGMNPIVFYSDPTAPFTREFLAGLSTVSMFVGAAEEGAGTVIVLGDPKFAPVTWEGQERYLDDPVTFSYETNTYKHPRFYNITRENSGAKYAEVVAWLRANHPNYRCVFLKRAPGPLVPSPYRDAITLPDGTKSLAYTGSEGAETYMAWFFTTPDFLTGVLSALDFYKMARENFILESPFDAEKTYKIL